MFPVKNFACKVLKHPCIDNRITYFKEIHTPMPMAPVLILNTLPTHYLKSKHVECVVFLNTHFLTGRGDTNLGLATI